jgi:imidazolonepropionase-like amidohydrolase
MHQRHSATDRGAWAVRAARLFDGTTTHAEFPLVFIERTRIVDVDLTGAHPSHEVPVVNLGDATLMPGLIDAHVHLAFDPARTTHEVMADEPESTLLERMHRHAEQYLSAGITTVRDLGDRDGLAVRLRRQYAGHEPLGPEILAAGPPLTRTDGHCWYLGGEADGPDGVRNAVLDRVSRGADVIKIMATGGVTTPGWGPHESQYSQNELTTAARTAHAYGRPITAHAHGRDGITAAVAAGVDGIEHGSSFTADGIDPDWDTVEAMATAGTFVGITEAWSPDGPPVSAAMRQRLERRCGIFTRMHRSGVRMVCCSDGGLSPRKPHAILAHGIVHCGANLGFTNTEALSSATSVAARSCGLGHRKGVIAAGYDADLIAVPGNPLEDLRPVVNPTTVIRAGSLLGSGEDALDKEALEREENA